MPTNSLNPPGFRSDINGLRTWAVVAVILYHFGVRGFGGGFVGVDVFFVISGFLMTGIVVSGLEKADGFSIWNFYLARARRIVPALMVLCTALLALGWFLLPPADYKKLGVEAAYSLAFLSNFKFWREAGYFDASSHEKWLLHTWSLAVEWQFYLLLPVALVAVWKLRPGRQTLAGALVFGLLLSYGLSVAITPIKPNSAFFLLPTRAWEMLAGGLVFLVTAQLSLSSGRRRILEAAGLLLMVGCVVGFDTATSWPGWRAMAPVLASALVLLAARPSSLWTANAAAQWLGTRSYSLYLWHWPVVVALEYIDAQDLPIAVLAGCALTALLGDLSYRLVESPARRHLSRRSFLQGVAVLLGGTASVAMAGLAINEQQGVLGRFSPEIDATSMEASNVNPRRKACLPTEGVASPSCMYGGSQLRTIVLGDSHAGAVVTAVASAVQDPRDGVMEWTYTGCPILPGVHNVSVTPNQCGAFVEWAMQELHSMPRDVPVVVVNRHGSYALGENEDEAQHNIPSVYFSRPYATAEPEFKEEYARHLTDTACALAKERAVYLVRPIPEMGVDVPSTARAMVWGEQNEPSITLAEYHQRNDFIWAAQDAARDQCAVTILDPLPYLCWDGVCHGAKDGRPLYYDDDHLSEFGNRLLIPMFAKVFESPGKLSAAQGERKTETK